MNAVLRKWQARPLAAGELSDQLLGRGLESELAAVFDARNLWLFASIGTLDDLSTRIAAGVPVLVGLQQSAMRVDSRKLVLVTAVDQGASTVTWQGEGAEPTTGDMESFMNLWRPVGFWMLTVCRPESVTWAAGLDELVLRARMYGRGGRPADAVRDYQAAVARQPRSAGLWMELGGALRAAHQPEEAEASYRKAVELCPDDGRPLNNLAFQLAEMGRDLADAEQLARRAVRLEPTNPAALDTLGLVLLQQSRFEEAENVLRRARQLAGALAVPQRGQITIHLARAHCGRGELGFARAMVKEALAEQPDLELPADLRLLLTPTTAGL